MIVFQYADTIYIIRFEILNENGMEHPSTLSLHLLPTNLPLLEETHQLF